MSTPQKNQFRVWNRDLQQDVKLDQQTRYNPYLVIMVSSDFGKHWCMARLEKIQEIYSQVYPSTREKL